MDRDSAVAMAQAAIKARNRRLVDAVVAAEARRGGVAAAPGAGTSPGDLPLIGVTCATGWECYAIVEELTKTRRFRVRALYRTSGTQAAARLEALHATTEAEAPGLLTLHSGVDLTSEEALRAAFTGCDGVVLYVTANTGAAGKIRNHGNDPVRGRAVVMNQVLASMAALRAAEVRHVVTLVFPPDKVTGIVDDPPLVPWWIQQRHRISDLLRDQGLDVTCIHRPAYYYAMHRVDYTNQSQVRGTSALSRTTIREGYLPGLNEPDFCVNWVDVRDVGKWVGTVFEHPDVFRNEALSVASCAMTGAEAVAIAERTNKHGTRFEYKQFPVWVMKMLSRFNEEVVYPLRYTQWYNAAGNGFDFASNDDLADLDRIHPRWTFERKLEDWGITELRPAKL